MSADDAGSGRDFPGRRWLVVVLRAAHLVAVVWLGSIQLGSPGAGTGPSTAVFVSGLLMFAVDLWCRPSHLRQWAGIGVVLKLALVAGMTIAPQYELALFWAVLLWSAILSHAPASFRNAPVF